MTMLRILQLIQEGYIKPAFEVTTGEVIEDKGEQLRNDTCLHVRKSNVNQEPDYPCRNCGSNSWWQREDGEWICGGCHPEPKPTIRDEIITLPEWF